MKCTVIIDPTAEEEILIRAHERSALVSEIEALASNQATDLIGYNDTEIAVLKPADVCCIFVEKGKVYAQTVSKKWQLKQRLYVLESLTDAEFIKINQSCLINVRHIKRFHTSVGGALTVTLQNGFRDYVSRRQLKSVKERLEL